jgi:hypothetical protein
LCAAFIYKLENEPSPSKYTRTLTYYFAPANWLRGGAACQRTDSRLLPICAQEFGGCPICAGIPLAYFVPAAPELCEGGYFVGQYLDCQPTDDLKE